MYRMGKEEVEAIRRVVESGDLFRVNTGACEVDNLEREFGKVIGTDYALMTSSGTAALVVSLVGLGIGPGDEVIVPGYTFMASASAVLAVGAIPVLAEIDETMTLDLKDVEKKISKYTKAIMPVHILGFPADMDGICAIAKKHGLLIIEDACQADGGTYKGRRLGSIGDVGAFSFNFFKLISVGEGGCVVTNDRKIYERALIYHDGGAAFRPYSGELETPVFAGMQFRASELMGAFMRVQLSRMDGIIEDLRRVKKSIIDGVSDIKTLRVAPSNDSAGEIATTLAFTFEDEETATRFNESLEGSVRTINSGKHVYSNWSPVMEHRGAHCDALNPYLMRENQGRNMAYTKDMLPRTLDILKRTVYITPHCDWSEEKIEENIRAIRSAATKLLKVGGTI